MNMTFDARRGRVVAFTDTGQTWEWDGSSWSRVNTPNSPGTRTEIAVAFDSLRDRVVLFGGMSGGAVLHDTWEYDGTTSVIG
jgi:hypothetical protein